MYIKIVEGETNAIEEELLRVGKEIDECKADIVRNTFATSQHVNRVECRSEVLSVQKSVTFRARSRS